MSFSGNEAVNGQPVFLYTFARVATVWRYTDQPADVTVSGVTYRAAVIAHEALERNAETAAGTVTVTCADATPIVAALSTLGLQGPPITCTIRQTHRAGVGDVVTPATAVRFKGVVQGRERTAGRCTFTLASVAAAFERPLLRVIASPTCNNAVYDDRCGVDKSLWQTSACEVTAMAGRTITVAEAALQADGYYTAAPITVEDGSAAGEYLFVESHVGDELTLLHVPPGTLAVGDHVSLFKGCKGTEAACIEFDNLERFLGFPRMPTVNPFEKVV